MTTKAKIIILLFIIVNSVISAQDDVHIIHFKIMHSKRIDNNKVCVRIFKVGKTNYNLNIVSEKLNTEKDDVDSLSNNIKTKDTTFVINKEQFLLILGSLKKISCSDIINNSSVIGKDGTICEVFFGSFSTGITYRIWYPNYKTEERKLKDFLYSCDIILTLAGLNPTDIF